MLIAAKLASAGLVALTIASATIATASEANAHNDFGAGLATGLVGGALVTGALVAQPGPAVVYRYGPYGPAPLYRVAAPHCHTTWHENHYGQIYPVRACAVWAR